MSGFQSFVRIAGAVVAAYFGQWQLAAGLLNYEREHRKAEKAKRRAIKEFNDAQVDRLEMVERDPRLARTRAYGRVRAVEGLHRPWTSGTNDQILTMPVSLAGHEIDGIEEYYLFDKLVTLDANGRVMEAPYRTSTGEVQAVFRTGDGTVTLLPPDDYTVSSGYVSGSASATWVLSSGDTETQGTATVTVVGTTATVSGAPSGSTVYVHYVWGIETSYCRIRSYLGSASQNIGAALAAEYPGKITSTDKAAGVAMLIVDCTFNPDVFPQGRPTPTCVFRGAKVYDPRKDSTVAGGSGAHRLATPSTWEWSRNPALIAYDWARYEFGCNINPALIVVADVIAAANACDVSTTYTLRMPDTSTTTVTQARFLCDVVLSTAGDPMEALETIADSMNGRVAWSGGKLRMRAGTMATASAAIDKTWLVEEVDQNGNADGDPVITAAQSVTRAQRWNRVSGSCVDPAQRYQMLPYPAVEDSTLIAAKGERETELDFPAVASVAQAQHLASMAIRQAQAGQRIEMRCGIKALSLELLDVFTLTLNDRHGITAKTYEVIGLQMAAGQPVRVQAAEISAALFTVDAELTGRDPAPDSDLPIPWDVETLAGLAVTSGGATVDSSILTRATVSWTAATQAKIRAGGYVEIQYAPAGAALPDGDWSIWTEPGTATQAVIPGLRADKFYIFRARFVQPLPLVRGAWSDSVLEQIGAVPLVDTGGIAPGAATDTASDFSSSGSVVSSSVPNSAVINSVAWTNSTADTVLVDVLHLGFSKMTGSGGGVGVVYAAAEYSVSSGGGAGGVTGAELAILNEERQFSFAQRVSVAAGLTITVTLTAWAAKASGTSISNVWRDVTTLVSAIKR